MQTLDKQHTSIALSLANISTPTMKFLALEEWAAANAAYESVDAPYWHVKPVASACTGVSGILWSISYILMATQGFKDKSYSMPIYCLCLNIAWESVYGFVYGPGLVNQIVFAQWMIIDAFLVYSTVKFGKDQWRHSPLVANNLGWIVLFGCIFCTWLHLSIAATFIPAIGRKVVPFTGWSLQAGISIGSFAQLITRGHTKGQSWGIWYISIKTLRG